MHKIRVINPLPNNVFYPQRIKAKNDIRRNNPQRAKEDKKQESSVPSFIILKSKPEYRPTTLKHGSLNGGITEPVRVYKVTD